MKCIFCLVRPKLGDLNLLVVKCIKKKIFAIFYSFTILEMFIFSILCSSLSKKKIFGKREMSVCSSKCDACFPSLGKKPGVCATRRWASESKATNIKQHQTVKGQQQSLKGDEDKQHKQQNQNVTEQQKEVGLDAHILEIRDYDAKAKIVMAVLKAKNSGSRPTLQLIRDFETLTEFEFNVISQTLSYFGQLDPTPSTVVIL